MEPTDQQPQPGDPALHERFSRQTRFAPFGEAGQRRLLESHIGIVGCGALGSFQAGALARAGAGQLTLIDRDYVELSNLHRQWLYDESDAAQALPKAVAAARHLAAINPLCRVHSAVADLTAANIADLLDLASILLDGTDNFETRYLLNDYAVSTAKPWIYGGAVASHGIVMPILPGRTACLACVYPTPPAAGNQPTCETAGVLNPITSVIASLQVAAVLRLAAGLDPLPFITTVDIWTGAIRQVRIPPPDPDCPTCGLRQFPHLNPARRVPISLCGRNAVQIHDRTRPLDLAALKAALEPLAPVKANEFALRFFPHPYEITVFPDGRAIIKGTTDPGLARALYSRYIGN